MKFILKIGTWIKGVFTNIIKVFSSFTEAIEESKMWKGLVKIYNEFLQVLHCESTEHEFYA